MNPARFRLVVSVVLIAGVGASATLITAGFLGSLLVGWEGSLVGAPDGTRPATEFGALVANLLAARPVGLAQAGVVTLILTPVVRVAASVIGFVLEGDRLYAGITLVVLVILLLSLVVLH